MPLISPLGDQCAFLFSSRPQHQLPFPSSRTLPLLPTPFDLIIIGAGPAGIAAADESVSRGSSRVLLLEARPRIGGRVRTLSLPDSPIPIELGAEFVHGQPASTWNLIRRFHAAAHDVPFENHELIRGRLRKTDAFDAQLERVMSGLARIRGSDISFADYLARSRFSAADRKAAADFVQGFDAADTHLVSARSLAHEWESIGNLADNRQSRLSAGYGPLLQQLLDSIDPRRLTLHLNEPAQRIRWSRSDVRVQTNKHTYRARAAIITLPISLLQLPQGSPGALQFEPDVPALAHARQIGMGNVVKVLLEFDSPFWEESEKLADAAFLHVPGAPFPTWWTTRPVRSAWLTGWAGGPFADALSSLPPSEVQAAALRSLSKLFGRSAQSLGKRIKRTLGYDWGADPLSRGAYSYQLAGQTSAPARLAQPVANTLFFAGEALDPDDPATVAGALASGRRAGKRASR
ncbi:MAG: flavin monoamine oxidase family protein [Phycisphaerales bacterium]